MMEIRKKFNEKPKESGMIMLQTIVFATIAVLIISALSSFTATTIRASRITFNREQAFQSAATAIAIGYKPDWQSDL